MAEIIIIGCGPGSPDYLTPIARRLALEADVLMGSPKLIKLFPESTAERVEVTRSSVAVGQVKSRMEKAKKIAVLVSGDPGISSMAKPVIRHFGAENCRVIPGISSVQFAFAKVGLEWSFAKIITAHKSDPDVDMAEIVREKKVAVLAGRQGALEWISRLADAMGENLDVFVCENLSMPDEKISKLTASELKGYVAPSMTIVLLVKRSA
jgi:precorrin-6y C5,15-methyltransferase (decarboxylating) CbiE subunit